jgi:hypothetical protein
VANKPRKSKAKKPRKPKGTPPVAQQLETALHGADETPAPMGRPTEYKREFCGQAKKLCEIGAIDTKIADFFGVDVRTLYRWRLGHPEFCQALKAGKKLADDRVEHALYRRATGFSHDAVKIFCDKDNGVTKVEYMEQFPPDTTACIFWLKNRRREEWRDKIDHSHSGIPASAPATIIIGGKTR